MKINCKQIAQKWKSELAPEIKDATLCIIQVGDSAASNAYVKGKIKDCEEVGVNATLIKLPEGSTYNDILTEIEQANKKYTGIILQLPTGLPKIDEEDLIAAISPEKDVDGLSTNPIVYPCTAAAVIRLLKNELKVNLEGKSVLVIGRSKLVGKPVADMLLRENATVTIAHSHTGATDLIHHIKTSDIIISAAGVAHLFYGWTPNSDAIVIDVGINRDSESGTLCGDFDPVGCGNIDYTPVPGGMGLLTRAQLLRNLETLYFAQKIFNK